MRRGEEVVRYRTVWTDIPPINSQAARKTRLPDPEARSPPGANHPDLPTNRRPRPRLLLRLRHDRRRRREARRRWIACDLGRFAIHTTRKRLLGIPDVRPFVVQNLGKYERQLWQAAEFGDASADSAHGRLPAASSSTSTTPSPIQGTPGSTASRRPHGPRRHRRCAGHRRRRQADRDRVPQGRRTGKDAPTTNASTCSAGTSPSSSTRSRASRPRAPASSCGFMRIPREVLDKRAVEQGDVRFFELAALSVRATSEGREVTLTLDRLRHPARRRARGRPDKRSSTGRSGSTTGRSTGTTRATPSTTSGRRTGRARTRSSTRRSRTTYDGAGDVHGRRQGHRHPRQRHDQDASK